MRACMHGKPTQPASSMQAAPASLPACLQLIQPARCASLLALPHTQLSAGLGTLSQLGFTREQVSKAILRWPAVVQLRSVGQLKQKRLY